MPWLDIAALNGGLLCFALATGLGLWGARPERRAGLIAARALAIAGAALLGLLLLRGGPASGSFPIAGRFETQIFIAALLAVVAVGIDLLRGLPVVTVGASPLAFMTVVVAMSVGSPPTGTPPPGSAWVGLHVLATLVAYVLFELAFVSGLLYLVEQRQLKTGAGGAAMLGFMPSLETLYRLLKRSLEIGVALLTVGVVVGYLYGRQANLPAGWRTDPKIILTTVTWAAYLVVIGLAFLPSFKGRRAAIACVGCFVLVMATLWASSFWTGFHRYS